jgi:ribosome modulation factor
MTLSFKLDPAAWSAGYAAGEAGEPLAACPYPAASQEAWSWHAGFIEGKAKRPERPA